MPSRFLDASTMPLNRPPYLPRARLLAAERRDKEWLQAASSRDTHTSAPPPGNVTAPAQSGLMLVRSAQRLPAAVGLPPALASSPPGRVTSAARPGGRITRDGCSTFSSWSGWAATTGPATTA